MKNLILTLMILNSLSLSALDELAADLKSEESDVTTTELREDFNRVFQSKKTFNRVFQSKKTFFAR